MRKKELLTRIQALERQVASQSATIEQLQVRNMPFGPVQPMQPGQQWPSPWLEPLKRTCEVPSR